MEKIYAIRFSDDIEADIRRDWSAYMHPSLGGTYEECERDCEEYGLPVDIREFEDGGFACVHHDGLSCYALENCNSVEDVIAAFNKDRALYDGSGFAQQTVGKVQLIKSIPAGSVGRFRDMHILLIDDFSNER